MLLWQTSNKVLRIQFKMHSLGCWFFVCFVFELGAFFMLDIVSCKKNQYYINTITVVYAHVKNGEYFEIINSMCM